MNDIRDKKNDKREKRRPGKAKTMSLLSRRLAVRLLDNDEDISEGAWCYLRQLLEEAGHQDIIDQVDATDGRFYLPTNAILKPEDRFLNSL